MVVIMQRVHCSTGSDGERVIKRTYSFFSTTLRILDRCSSAESVDDSDGRYPWPLHKECTIGLS